MDATPRRAAKKMSLSVLNKDCAAPWLCYEVGKGRGDQDGAPARLGWKQRLRREGTLKRGKVTGNACSKSN